ncbi:hypothetical protein N399_09265 [Bacillus licheniformis CG-B52]|nr:hypothetical protein N399_09265 [Bacillus licheniformis CG-B52]KUL13106.1 hypothetical protein LI17339_00925 [Bacillus licheniformis LMG 17339]
MLHKSKLVVQIDSSAVKKIFFMYDMKKENSNYEKAVFLFHDQKGKMSSADTLWYDAL